MTHAAHRPIRLVLLDLDGTTLQHDSSLSARTRRAVRSVTARGVAVVLSSARPPRGMRRYHCELELETPLICYNGALVMEASGDLIFRRCLDLDLAREVVSFLRTACPLANLSLECDDTWHIDRVDDDLRAALARYRIDHPHTEGQIEQVLEDEAASISKVIIGSKDAVPDLAAAFREAFGERLCLAPAGDLLEVVAEGVSKGAAGAIVCTRMGFDRLETAAFGDQYNDIPMLEFAGLAIAMENAPPGVREFADLIAPPSTDDGVARVLEYLMASGRIGIQGEDSGLS